MDNNDKENNYFISWSWEGFLFSSAWFCYLKMYLYSFIIILAELGIIMSTIFFMSKENSDKTNGIIFGYFISFILFRILIGLFGKSIHLIWLKRKNILLSDAPKSLIAFVFMPMLLNIISALTCSIFLATLKVTEYQNSSVNKPPINAEATK